MKNHTTVDIVSFDVQKIREDFPILSTQVNGNPLIYFDNAATSQKPWAVINAIQDYYTRLNSNVHRGVHHLSQMATDSFEAARKEISRFINASTEAEVIYTKGTTDSINLVAYSYGRNFVGRGDTILISALEHHSNIVPWQILCEERGANLAVIPVNQNGELVMESYREMLNSRVKLVGVNYVSNALGTVNPVHEIIELAHGYGIPVLLDAAQAIQHIPIDVRDLDVDFLAFSGHKMYGPTGIGVLYGKSHWLNQMSPYQAGGEMIRTVSFDKTTYNELPFKFEAGTPNIEAAICLSSAIRYITSIGLERIQEYEHELLQYGIDKLSTIESIRFVGTAQNRSSVISFNVDGAHPYDVGVILDQLGIAVRTGHHCAQPLMDIFGIPGTVRASFAFYNTREEIDRMTKAVSQAADMLR